MSRSIRHQEITLEEIAGERTVEEIRTVTGISGDGASNDLISVHMALELGCQISQVSVNNTGLALMGNH